MVIRMSEMGPGQNPGQAPPGAGQNTDDPGANTQMFQAYASTRSAEPEGRNRVTMLLIAAGLFVLAVVVIVLLFVTG
ncbi:hypothetical protein GCM10027569_36750 [Flindersiella endophytica]